MATPSLRQIYTAGPKKSVADEGKPSPSTSLEAHRASNAAQNCTETASTLARRRVIVIDREENQRAPEVHTRTTESAKLCSKRFRCSSRSNNSLPGALRKRIGAWNKLRMAAMFLLRTILAAVITIICIIIIIIICIARALMEGTGGRGRVLGGRPLATFLLGEGATR